MLAHARGELYVDVIEVCIIESRRITSMKKLNLALAFAGGSAGGSALRPLASR